MELNKALGCFALLGCLEMPAWNGRAGSGRAGSVEVPLALGVVDLVDILAISHCPLENDLYFTWFSFPSFETW